MSALTNKPIDDLRSVIEQLRDLERTSQTEVASLRKAANKLAAEAAQLQAGLGEAHIGLSGQAGQVNEAVERFGKALDATVVREASLIEELATKCDEIGDDLRARHRAQVERLEAALDSLQGSLTSSFDPTGEVAAAFRESLARIEQGQEAAREEALARLQDQLDEVLSTASEAQARHIGTLDSAAESASQGIGRLVGEAEAALGSLEDHCTQIGQNLKTVSDGIRHSQESSLDALRRLLDELEQDLKRERLDAYEDFRTGMRSIVEEATRAQEQHLDILSGLSESAKERGGFLSQLTAGAYATLAGRLGEAASELGGLLAEIQNSEVEGLNTLNHVVHDIEVEKRRLLLESTKEYKARLEDIARLSEAAQQENLDGLAETSLRFRREVDAYLGQGATLLTRLADGVPEMLRELKVGMDSSREAIEAEQEARRARLESMVQSLEQAHRDHRTLMEDAGRQIKAHSDQMASRSVRLLEDEAARLRADMQAGTEAILRDLRVRMDQAFGGWEAANVPERLTKEVLAVAEQRLLELKKEVLAGIDQRQGELKAEIREDLMVPWWWRWLTRWVKGG